MSNEVDSAGRVRVPLSVAPSTPDPDPASTLLDPDAEQEPIVQPTLGDRITVLRQMKNWTQAQLARETSLSRPYVRALEAGHAREPRARTIGLLCQALDTDVIDLMQAVGALPPNYHDCQIRAELDLTMYLRRQRRLSEEFVALLIDLIHLAEEDEGVLGMLEMSPHVAVEPERRQPP